MSRDTSRREGPASFDLGGFVIFWDYRPHTGREHTYLTVSGSLTLHAPDGHHTIHTATTRHPLTAHRCTQCGQIDGATIEEPVWLMQGQAAPIAEQEPSSSNNTQRASSAVNPSTQP